MKDTWRTADATFEAAVALLRQGRLEEAQAAFREVLQLQPQHAAASNLLGTIALTMNAPVVAIDWFAKALRINPHQAAIHVNCGNAHAMLGQYEAAIAHYDQALALDPESNAMPYYYRGTALHESRQYEAAIASYDQALALQSDLDGVACYGRAAALLALEQHSTAIDYFRRSIAFGPHYAAEAHQGCAIALMALERWQEALGSCEEALVLKPNYSEAMSSRIAIQVQLKLWEAGLASCDRLIALKPNSAEAFYNRGVIQAQIGHHTAALASYDSALVLDPNHAEAFANRGSVLFRLNRLEAALASCERAISLKPDYAQAFLNRGVIQAELRQWEAALVSYERAIELNPEFVAAYSNRSCALAELGRWQEALTSCERAIAIAPEHAEAFSNRGIVLAACRQWESALSSYERAITLRPDYAEAHLNRSMLWLLLGEYAKGWHEYEWREARLGRVDLVNQRRFPQPRWSGAEPIAGKSILLHSEQGLGDTLQFCRYTRLVASLGARVILEAPAPLLSVLSTLAGVSQLISRGSRLPDFDYQCPLMSLPLAFKTDLHSIPNAIRYLGSDKLKVTQWNARLGVARQPRIGLAWSGNSAKARDRHRSVALADLLRCLPADLQYVSLQKEIRETDKRTLQTNPQILDFSEDLGDFADTAALCELMDVVISVDTSVAHLSAALGRPTWILLPFSPDWRWLLERSDSPWYPSVKLYRQEASGNWHTTLERVARDLSATVAYSAMTASKMFCASRDER